MIASDHGTEVTCNAVLAWCQDNKNDWHFIHRARKAHAEGLRTACKPPRR